MNLKCPQRVLVICSHKDHADLAADELQHFEAVEPWHLNIEKQQIGFQFRDCFYSLKPIGTLRDNLHVVMCRQVFAHQLARELFVVDDRDSHYDSMHGN